MAQVDLNVASKSPSAPIIPSAAQLQETTFINGVIGSVVGAPSYYTWQGSNPAIYSAASDGHKWGDTTIGTPGGDVTYWFDAASDWTTGEENAFVSGLALWSDEANITFSEAASAASADFIFERGAPGSGAFENNDPVSNPVGSSTEDNPTNTVISMDTSQPEWVVGSSFVTAGGYSWDTLVHEEGHMLGLGHDGPYNGNVNTSQQQYSPYDTQLWSLMSYIAPSDPAAKYFNSYPVTGTSWDTSPDGYDYSPTTPMILDILAVQQLYGAPTGGPLTNGGTTFGFNCNVEGDAEEYFDFTVNTHPVVTIYDSGPDNTLDLSGFSGDATINLNPGTFTSCNGEVNNIGIAFGTDINNVVGTTGNDVIIVNGALTGTLTGNGVGDTFEGTMAGLSLYTITDMHAGDTLYFTDASFSDFEDTRVGTELTYNDGPDSVAYSVTLSNDPIGNFVEAADPAGGVDLSLESSNPPPPAGTSAVMIMSQFGIGNYEIYDLGQSTILAAYYLTQINPLLQVVGLGSFGSGDTSDMMLRNESTGALQVYNVSNNNVTGTAPIGQVGLEWSVVGFGNFSGQPNETDMLMRDSNTGAFEVYDIGDNQLTSAAPMGQVGLEWSVAGFGDFSGNANETDMLMRSTNTGAFEVYDISHNTITSAGPMGQVGSEWQVAGFGDFSGNANETDMLMRNSNTGAFEVYDISDNQLTSAASMGQVGLEWSVAGFGDFSGNANETDMLMRNTDTGAFEIYDTSNNTITFSAQMGQVGLDWSIGGISNSPASAPPSTQLSGPAINPAAASLGGLTQAMASFAPSVSTLVASSPPDQTAMQSTTVSPLAASASQIRQT